VRYASCTIHINDGLSTVCRRLYNVVSGVSNFDSSDCLHRRTSGGSCSHNNYNCGARQHECRDDADDQRRSPLLRLLRLMSLRHGDSRNVAGKWSQLSDAVDYFRLDKICCLPLRGSSDL